MTVTQLLLGGFVWTVFVAVSVEWLTARRIKRAQTATVNRAADLLEEENHVVQQWKVLYLEECRKRLEQFRMIQGIQTERDHWKDIFWQCSREHGVAQEYMVRVNQHFAQILRRSPDNKMAAIWQAFKAKYGEEARLEIAERISRGEPGLARAPEPAPLAEARENAARDAVVVAKVDPNA